MIIKRTTFVVDSAETMLRFYRDVLQWRVDYDAPMTLNGGLIPGSNPGDQVRLVIMGGEDREIAKIGLLEWTAPRLPAPRPATSLGIGDMAIVADVNDIQGLHARLKDFPGVRIITPPVSWNFPAPDGSGELQLTSMNFFDPAGIVHEVYYRHNRPNPAGYLIRRCSRVVRDCAAVAAFYRDTLGLTQYQDGSHKNSGMVFPAGEPEQMLRLIVCRAQHPYIGMIGALQLFDPPLPEPAPRPPLYCGAPILIAHTDDAAGLAARVQASGVTVTRPPYSRTVPKMGGGTTAMISFGFIDPGGLSWEVNQRT